MIKKVSLILTDNHQHPTEEGCICFCLSSILCWGGALFDDFDFLVKFSLTILCSSGIVCNSRSSLGKAFKI